jgi:hypothetical protein
VTPSNITKLNQAHELLRKLTVCIGAVWLGGRMVPMVLSDVIEIAPLTDFYVLICGIFLLLFAKSSNHIFHQYEKL